MRRCEERIVVLNARNATSALCKAKSHGNQAEFKGQSKVGNVVYFEFVGVLDLLELGIECLQEEVWYDISVRKTPMEYRGKLIPQEEMLNAIFLERQSMKSSGRVKRKMR